jgi:hypothetical protein
MLHSSTPPRKKTSYRRLTPQMVQSTSKVLPHVKKYPAGRYYCPMGCSDDHRSQGLGLSVPLRLKIPGPCNLPDDIPSPTASTRFGKPGRQPSHVNLLVSRRRIKIQNCGRDTPYNPLRQHFLPNNTLCLYFHLRADRTSNHVATSTHKTENCLKPHALARPTPSLAKLVPYHHTPLDTTNLHLL